MALLVSVGQAAANALAAWLRASVTPDITVYDRWPEPNVPMFASPTPSGASARGVVSVVKVGKRTRLSVVPNPVVDAAVKLPDGTYEVTFRIGSYVQPLQLDVWTKSDDDRDDLIAQMDSLLNAGIGQTFAAQGVLGDPVRDGVLVPLLSSDGYSGNVDCIFDEPEIEDSPDAAQLVHYRATYFGEAQGVFSRVVVVPALTSMTLKEKLYAGATVPASMLYDTTTVTPTGTTHGTST